MTRAARLTRRQEQGEQSRQQILDAAERLMAAHGFDGASMSHISKESGLPTSSIYWHFASKEGVLAAVMERGSERFFATVDALDTPPDAPPIEHIRAELRLAALAMEREADFLRLFMLLLLSGQQAETRQRVRATGRAILHRRLFEAFRSRGDAVAARVADELINPALAMFDGTFLAVQNDPSLRYTDLLERMAEALAALGDATAAERAADGR